MGEDRLGKAVLELVADSKAFYADLKNAEKAGTTLGQHFAKVGASMKEFGDRVGGVGRSLTASLTLPIVGVGIAAVKSFAEFDQAMTESVAIMGSQGQEMRGQMEEVARTVARTTTASSEQAAKAYYFLASAGLDAAQSMAALPAVAEFAQAGVVDLETATSLLANSQSALGMTSKDAGQNLANLTRISDVLVKANILADGSTRDFADALTNKAAVALKLVGKDVEEGAAVLAAFAAQGIKGEVAGEQLAIVLRDLQVANIKSRSAWDAHKIAVYDASSNMRNMGDIVGDLTRVLGPMSDEQKRATLMQLGFKDKSVAATQALIGMEGKIREYEASLRKAGGTTKEVADLQRDSFKFALHEVTEAVKQAAEALGKALAPTLRDLAKDAQPAIEWLTRAAELFGKLPEPVRATVIVIAGLAAAVGPVLMVFGSVVSSIGVMMPALVALGPVIAALGPYFMAVAASVAPIIAVGGVAFLFTKWLMDSTEAGRWLADAIGGLVNKLLSIDTAFLEKGKNSTAGWTDEERKLYQAVVDRANAHKAAAAAAAAGEAAGSAPRQKTRAELEQLRQAEINRRIEQAAVTEAALLEGAIRGTLSQEEKAQFEEAQKLLEEKRKSVEELQQAERENAIENNKMWADEAAAVAAHNAAIRQTIGELQVAIFGTSKAAATEAAYQFGLLQTAVQNAGLSITTMSQTALVAYEAQLVTLEQRTRADADANNEVVATLGAVRAQLYELGVGLVQLQDPATKAAAAWGTVEYAASKMGYKSREELRQTANEAVATYERMRASGLYTAAELQKAFEAAEQAKREARGETAKYEMTAGQAWMAGTQQILGALGQKHKSAAIAGAILATYQAIAKALASAPWPANLALAAGAAAAGWMNVSKIRSSQPGYATGTPGLDFADFGSASPQWLHNEEAVIPRGRGHLLAAEIADAMPGGDDGSAARLDRIAESLDRLPHAMTRAWKNALATA